LILLCVEGLSKEIGAGLLIQDAAALLIGIAFTLSVGITQWFGNWLLLFLKPAYRYACPSRPA
jgi:hypothetical protein